MDISRFFRNWLPLAYRHPKSVETSDTSRDTDRRAGLGITPGDVVDYIKAGHATVELHSERNREFFGRRYRDPDEGGSFFTSGGNEVSRDAMIAELELKLREGWGPDKTVREQILKFKKRRMSK